MITEITLKLYGIPESAFSDDDEMFDIVHQINAEDEKRSGMRLRILTPH